jgi:hypothetical protein
MFMQGAGAAERTYDAIVVGSGISGGWAAKELTQKGLRTLVLERGRDVKHPDYPTAMSDSWEFAGRNKISQAELAKQEKQNRTGYTTHPASAHWFVNDVENPYSEVQRFDWMRGYHVGGRSLLCGDGSHIDSATWTSKPTLVTAWPSTGRSDTGTSRRGTTMPSVSPVSAEASRGCRNCRTASFCRRWR